MIVTVRKWSEPISLSRRPSHSSPATVTSAKEHCKPAVFRACRAVSVVFAAAVCLTQATAVAQGLNFGGEGRADSFRERIGECPVEQLRAAWGELSPLEGAAVEAEVLRLCTERAELINGFIRAQAGLDIALGGLLAGQAAEREAISGLSPSATANEDAAVSQQQRTPKSVPDATEPAAEAGQTSDWVLAHASGPDSSEYVEAAQEVADGRSTGETANAAQSSAPDRIVLESLVSTVPAKLAPSEPPDSSWEALYAVQSGTGPWLALLEGRTCREITKPAAEPGAPALLLTECDSVRLLIGIGDRLPDGRRVMRISPVAVHVLPPAGEDGFEERVPWKRAGDEAAPAWTAWNAALEDPLP